jgi:hypothetical protein
MAKQKPTNPAGRSTGFPYPDLWEELEPNWEDPTLIPGVVRTIQSELKLVQLLGGPAHLGITQDQISALLQPLTIEPETRERLAVHLHCLAGMFLQPEISEFWKESPDDAKKKLEKLGEAAEALSDALSSLTPEAGLILQFFRNDPPDQSEPDYIFDCTEMLPKTQALAKRARQIVHDMPANARGRSFNFGRDRWIWCAARAIEHWTGNSVRAPQTDKTGRNPRLRGPEGDVLLSYLRLLLPQIVMRTIVRIITSRRLKLKAGPAS